LKVYDSEPKRNYFVVDEETVDLGENITDVILLAML